MRTNMDQVNAHLDATTKPPMTQPSENTPLFELAVNDCNNQNHENRDNRYRYNPIRSHPDECGSASTSAVTRAPPPSMRVGGTWIGGREGGEDGGDVPTSHPS